jgi:hypothetical protein
MSNEETVVAGFRQCARHVAAVLTEELGWQVPFGRQGVERLADYLEQARPLLVRPEQADAVTSLGAFLGECILQECGGRWTHQSGWWGIELAEGVVACPFVQIQQQLSAGEEQSCQRYLECLIHLVRQLSVSVTDGESAQERSAAQHAA